MIIMGNADNVLFDNDSRVAPLGLIAMAGASELGKKVDGYLTKWANENEFVKDTFLVEAVCPRFSSGDGKGLIKSSIRGDDLFILCDVGNYSCTYNYFGRENSMSPDDHYQDLKRIIQAAGGKAHRINIIMPSLYGGRQHRRNYRESLDCAVALQELQSMGVSNILTFDAHDPRVQNAVPLMGLDNIIPSYQVLKAMFKNLSDFRPDKDHFMIISPDEGAINRNMYYASVLGVNLGMFYKRRDYSVVVDGRNPIIAHEFLGDNVEGKDVVIVDDMISSGESMIEVATKLKELKARRIFVCTCFGLFCNGLEAFDKAYESGLINKVFTTNLIYRTPELKQREWYVEVDLSKYISYVIDTLNHDTSVSKLLDPKDRINNLLVKKGFRTAEEVK